MCHHHQTISQVFGECTWMGQKVGLTGERHALVQTLISALYFNLSMSPKSSCFPLLHYPISLMYLLPCLEVFSSQFQSPSTVAPVPRWLHDWFPSLSSQFRVTRHRSPCIKSHCYSPNHLCLSFTKPKWGIQLIPEKFESNWLTLWKNLSQFGCFFKESIIHRKFWQLLPVYTGQNANRRQLKRNLYSMDSTLILFDCFIKKNTNLLTISNTTCFCRWAEE